MLSLLSSNIILDIKSLGLTTTLAYCRGANLIFETTQFWRAFVVTSRDLAFLSEPGGVSLLPTQGKLTEGEG